MAEINLSDEYERNDRLRKARLKNPCTMGHHDWEVGDDGWGVIIGVSKCRRCGKVAASDDFRDAQEYELTIHKVPRRKSEKCVHEGWSFNEHGRRCHKCGEFLVDFGD